MKKFYTVTVLSIFISGFILYWPIKIEIGESFHKLIMYDPAFKEIESLSYLIENLLYNIAIILPLIFMIFSLFLPLITRLFDEERKAKYIKVFYIVNLIFLITYTAVYLWGVAIWGLFGKVNLFWPIS